MELLIQQGYIEPVAVESCNIATAQLRSERCGDLTECRLTGHVFVGDMMNSRRFGRYRHLGIYAPRFGGEAAVRHKLHKRYLHNTVGLNIRTGRLQVKEYYWAR